MKRFNPIPHPKGLYNYLCGMDSPYPKFSRYKSIKEESMSEKTKKIVRAVSTGVTICGVVGLFVSGATEAEVSEAVKVGTMIAAIIGSLITTLLPRK